MKNLRMNLRLALFLVAAAVALGIVAFIDFDLSERFTNLFCAWCCLTIYVFAQNTDKISDESSVRFLGPSFLFIGLFDAANAFLTRKGTIDASLTTYLIGCGAWFKCAAFISLPVVQEKGMRGRALVRTYAIYVTLTAAAAAAGILFVLPRRDVPPYSLAEILATSAALAAAYAVAISRLGALIIDGKYRRLLMASSILSAISYPAMIASAGTEGAVRLASQVFRFASYYLVYKAVVAYALLKPYKRIFRSIERKSRHLESLNARLESALAEKSVLLNEIHHRVKNNLQIIASLLELESRKSAPPRPEEMFVASQERIRSMALVHEMLYESADQGRVDLAAYTERLISSLRHIFPSGVRIETELDRVSLPLDRTFPCALAMSEMITNAAKYGIDEHPEPRVAVRVRFPPDQGTRAAVAVEVEDNGPGLPAGLDPAASRSLGLTLMRSMADQLGGTVGWYSVDPGSRLKGLRVRIEFPLEE